jgi:hypothetical protein
MLFRNVGLAVAIVQFVGYTTPSLGQQQQKPNPTPRIIPIVPPFHQTPPPQAPRPTPANQGIRVPLPPMNLPPNPAFAPASRSFEIPFDLGGWEDVAPKGAGCRFALPRIPVESTQSVASGAGKIELRLFGLDNDPARYLFAYNDLSPARDARPFDVYRSAAIRMAKELGGQVLSERTVTLSGMDGFEVSVQAGDGTIVRDRMVLKDGRLYQLIVTGDERAVVAPDAEKFMRSLRVSLSTDRGLEAEDKPTSIER